MFQRADQFVGAAKRLDDIDIARAAAAIGCGEDEIHAVLDVEAAGSGFDSLGRPRILFEPHVFYRNLSGAAREAAVSAGLAASSWGAIPYGAESAQYGRLERALAIDETAALKSCSWGRAQILGENFAMVGYASPQDMVVDFMADEERHLEAMVRFIQAAGIDDDLRQHDWAGFARVYNGSGYAKNRYDRKLAERFAWWSGKPDTPLPPAAAPVAPSTPAGAAMPAIPTLTVEQSEAFWAHLMAAFGVLFGLGRA